MGVQKIKFYYDGEKSKQLETKLFEHYVNQPRGHELHAYDIVYCPLKAYNRLTGKQQKPTKQTIGFLVFGVISGNIIQALFPPDQREYETSIENVIWCHLDVYEQFVNPLEVKATRKRVFKRSQVPEGWVKQLMVYMSSVMASKGWLVILNVFSNQISCFCLEMTTQELLAQRLLALNTGKQIVEAVKQRSPDLLEPHYEECSQCMYKKSCNKYKRVKKK